MRVTRFGTGIVVTCIDGKCEEKPSGVAGSVQGKPEDPIVKALEKEKLAQQVEQLKTRMVG